MMARPLPYSGVVRGPCCPRLPDLTLISAHNVYLKGGAANTSRNETKQSHFSDRQCHVSMVKCVYLILEGGELLEQPCPLVPLSGAVVTTNLNDHHHWTYRVRQKHFRALLRRSIVVQRVPATQVSLSFNYSIFNIKAEYSTENLQKN